MGPVGPRWARLGPEGLPEGSRIADTSALLALEKGAGKGFQRLPQIADTRVDQRWEGLPKGPQNHRYQGRSAIQCYQKISAGKGFQRAPPPKKKTQIPRQISDPRLPQDQRWEGLSKGPRNRRYQSRSAIQDYQVRRYRCASALGSASRGLPNRRYQCIFTLK